MFSLPGGGTINWKILKNIDIFLIWVAEWISTLVRLVHGFRNIYINRHTGTGMWLNMRTIIPCKRTRFLVAFTVLDWKFGTKKVGKSRNIEFSTLFLKSKFWFSHKPILIFVLVQQTWDSFQKLVGSLSHLFHWVPWIPQSSGNG